MNAVRYIELHYFLSDGSHSMNAFVFNKCEREILGIVNEIASKLECYPLIEVEPIENGGLRSWLKLNSEKLTIGNALLIAFLPAFVVNILSTPIQELEKEFIHSIVDRLLEDSEIKELKTEKEKIQLQLEILDLKEKLEKKRESIDIGLIKKKRSNFYASMLELSKIESLDIVNENIRKDATIVYNVPRENFTKFLLTSNELDPLIDEHASIEIISPVLKKGRYKWSGIYMDNPIHFSMNSREFKNLVEVGAVSFKNGSVIDCRLISHRKLDENGCSQITKHEVDLVNTFVENGVARETPEGRRNRLDKKAKNDQLNFLNELK